MNVMFMGTPDIAVPFLNEVHKSYNVCCVVTQPDKPRGRGHILSRCPVAETADNLGIDVIQPDTFKENAFLPVLYKYKPDLIAVVAYGRILPKYVLEYPKYGCINVHASLLPKHRGACPINKAIMDGDTVTGVTTMIMSEGLDTGDMLLKKEIEITPYMTAGELHDIICEICPCVLTDTIDKIDTIIPVKQNENEATYTGMLTKENTKIDWSKTPKEIVDFIRGLNPFPTAHTTLNGKGIKVYGAIVSAGKGDKGVIIDTNNKIVVACNGGAVEITELQLESKKRMSAQDLLRGYKISVGEVLL